MGGGAIGGNTASVSIGGSTVHVTVAQNGGGANPGGWPSGTSSWAAPAPSGGGSAAPPAPAPASSGSGASGGTGGGSVGANNAPPEPGWERFWHNVQKNPTFGGLYHAAVHEMPIGAVASVTGAMAAMSLYGHAAYAGQRPQFENRLAQESAMLHGQYVPMAIRAGQSQAADIRGSMAYDRALLSPLNSVTFGLAGLAYDMGTGQMREEAAMRAEAEAHTSQNLMQLGALSGVSQAELRRRFGTRQHTESNLGWFGNMRRSIGQSANKYKWGDWNGFGVSAAAGLDDSFFHFFSAAANAGVTDEFQFDEESAKYAPAMTAARRMALGLGSSAEGRMFTDPKAFGRAFGKAVDTFGDSATLQSLGLVAHGMTNDPSQMGMYRRGSGIEDFTNARVAARTAALRGQDISGFVPSFYQNNAMQEFTALEDQRRTVLELQGAGAIAGFAGSSASARMSMLHATGANFPEMQQQMDVQAAATRRQLSSAQGQYNLAPTDYDKARLQAEIDSLKAQLAAVPKMKAELEYGMRQTGLGAFSMGADTNMQRVMYSGGGADALDRAFGGQASGVLGNAALLREKARRADLYDPQTRAMFTAQAEQQEFHARVTLPRQASQMRFGLDMGEIGVANAEAGAAGSQARLFGGPAAGSAAVQMQASAVAQEIRAVQDLLKRGNTTREEQLKYQGELVRLGAQQKELQAEAVRGQARGEYNVAGGNLGVASTEQRTAFLKGVGGMEGQGLTFGLMDKAGVVTKKAQAYVDLLRRSGVSEDNAEMISARQSLASSQQQEMELSLSQAHTPLPVGMSRELSRARYEEQVLGSLPGSYGNIRGSLRKQAQTLERAGILKAGELQAARQKNGGKLDEAVEAQFQEELQQIGLQQASVYQKLNHGGMERLVSQTLGTPGNFSFIARNFSYRDAIGAGVHNPYFGSNAQDLPFYRRDEALWGAGASLAGSTGTAAGFNATALSGIAPINKFGGVSGQANMVNPMAQLQAGQELTVNVNMKMQYPDGRMQQQNVRGTARMTPQRLNLNANEDLQNDLVMRNQGQ